MPTVILLDVSLSMLRPVPNTDGSESEYTRKHLAVHAVNILLDHLASQCKLEFVSLVNNKVYAYRSINDTPQVSTKDFVM